MFQGETTTEGEGWTAADELINTPFNSVTIELTHPPSFNSTTDIILPRNVEFGYTPSFNPVVFAGYGQITIGVGAISRNNNECVIGNASLERINSGNDNGTDLGSPDRQFKDLYLGGKIHSKDIDILEKKINNLELKFDKMLKTFDQILFAPGGPVFEEAKASFESKKTKILLTQNKQVISNIKEAEAFEMDDSCWFSGYYTC